MRRTRAASRATSGRSAAYQERVETEDELAVAVEELEDAVDDAGRVDLLALEGLHDLQKFIINLGLVAELGLDLVEVEERVLDLCSYKI